jgi:hypothetical protein
MTAKKITFADVYKWATGKGGFATVFLTCIGLVGSNAESYITKAVEPIVKSQMEIVIGHLENRQLSRDSILMAKFARGMARLEIRLLKAKRNDSTIDGRIKRNREEKELTKVYISEMED